jgi:hypothetical protein
MKTILAKSQDMYTKRGLVTFGMSITADGSRKHLHFPKSWQKLEAAQKIKCHENALGVLVGWKKGMVIIDLDKKRKDDCTDKIDGIEFWAKLEDQFGAFETPTVNTPSGGAHYYFKPSAALEGVKKQVCKLVIDSKGGEYRAKVDFLTDGNCVIGVGSENPVHGARYTFREGRSFEDTELLQIPEWVENFILCKHCALQEDGSIEFVFEEENEALPVQKSAAISSYNFTFEEFCGFLDRIEPLAKPYETWRDVIFSLNNMFKGKLFRDLAHYFSSSCRRSYNKHKVDEFLDGLKDTDGKGYRLNNLKQLCKKHKLTEALNYIEELCAEKRSAPKARVVVLEKYDTSVHSEECLYKMYETLREINTKKLMYEEFVEKFYSMIGRTVCFLVEKNCFCYRTSDNPFELSNELPRAIVTYLKTNNEGELVSVTQPLKSFIEKTWDNFPIRSSITFDPSCTSQDSMINCWQGFKARLLPRHEVDSKRCGLILSHLKEVWCSDSEQDYDYLIGNYFGEMFRTPASKKGIAVNLVSKQGAGKGIIIDDFLIKYVFGEHMSAAMTGFTKITQRFNAVLMNKLFISINELPSFDVSRKDAFDTIKSLITDSMQQIEIKNGPIMQYPVFTRFIFSTNYELSVNIENGDRRYHVLKCSPKYVGDISYFTNLSKSINQNSANHFFSFCYYYKSAQNPRMPPMTVAKREAIESCTTSSHRFLLRVKEIIGEAEEEKNDGPIFGHDFRTATLRLFEGSRERGHWIAASELYNLYKEFCEEERERNLVSNTKFGRLISSYITKRKTKIHHEYNLLTIVGLS